MDWTLQILVDELAEHDPSLTLSFETADGAAGPGFHVTELKHARVSSIDCGGNLNGWDEVGLQLLDGYGNDPMSLEKFARIAAHSLRALPALGDAPIYVEFSPENTGLMRHTIGGTLVDNGKLVVNLESDAAACKPAVRAAQNCCGPVNNIGATDIKAPAASACC